MSDYTGEPQETPPDPAAALAAQLTTKATGEADRIDRDTPQPTEERRRLVQRWIARVRADKEHYEPQFRRMRANMAFVQGHQWGQDRDAAPSPTPRENRYVANIALRHVQQRTAALYASNPKVIALKRDRLLASVWDGDAATLQQAQQDIAQATLAAQQQGLALPPGGFPPGTEQAAAIVADFKAVQGYDKMLERVCRTLECLYQQNVEEQTYPFKAMMKLSVRRAIVTGVGWVKLGFQRAMKMIPEVETRIADMVERLATIERLANDIADGEIQRDAGEVEQLRLSIAAMQKESQIIVREGLLWDYPDSTAIIPDRKAKSLRGFLGADWVSQEYMLTPDEIQEVYGVDVASSYRSYTLDQYGRAQEGPSSKGYGADGDDDDHDARGAVWEIYSRKDGLVYTVCDGYPDFLREPTVPDVYLDRFYPWFGIVLNEGYHEREIYPLSDIDLLRDMQLELNRARQGLREHRRANRPKTAVAAGVLEDEDKEKLKTHPANAVIELNGLAPNQKVEDVLMPFKMPPIDPALYDTNQTFEDILRVLGQDQASTGQTTSASATEAAVAQAAQHTDLASVIDDQDDLLSEMAQAAGKVLLMNVSPQTVQKVCGPGAVWPELSKSDIIENVYLSIRAGSTGRPNRQQEIQAAQILFPMLQRVPGISPQWMARELVKRLDDRLDITEAFVEGQPSMDAINRIQGTVATPPPQDPQNPVVSGQIQIPPGPAPVPMPAGMMARPGTRPPPGRGGSMPMAPPMGGAPNDPTAQGPMGAANAPVPNPPNGLLGPRLPPVPGANGLMPGRGGGPRLTPQGGTPMP